MTDWLEKSDSVEPDALKISLFNLYSKAALFSPNGETKRDGLVMINACDIERKPIEWLIPNDQPTLLPLSLGTVRLASRGWFHVWRECSRRVRVGPRPQARIQTARQSYDF